MNRTLRTLVVYGLSIIMLAILAQWWFDQVQGPEVIELSQFIDNVEAGDYEAVEMLAALERAPGPSRQLDVAGEKPSTRSPAIPRAPRATSSP